jgi:hypothetical protein
MIIDSKYFSFGETLGGYPEEPKGSAEPWLRNTGLD